MVQAQQRVNVGLALAALIFGLSVPVRAQDQPEEGADPPSRVARLSYTTGTISMEPAGVNDWAPADVNRPFTTGDYLYADQNSAAELQLDVAAIRMAAQTSFGFLNLDDRTVQIKLTEGDLYIRVRNWTPDQVFEVDTPNAAVTLLQNGIYRFRVDANGNMSFVVVRQGQAEITGGGQAFTLNADNSATLTGTDQLQYDIELAPQPDPFDQWCQARDAHEEQLAARDQQYVPPTMVGADDLGDYGVWQEQQQYGAVWYPNSVPAGWAPYQSGHWAWIAPWGWTWVDSTPWGFAPFHYGRWAYIGNRWGWCPGPVVRGPAVMRPYYAPAMVAWFGGAHWGVGVSLGGGPSLGWVPLGWGEVYTPAYHCSPRYFNNVNVYNTRIVNTVNITNVYKTVYVNKQVYNQQFVNVRAPHAVMAMPQSAFASGQPVRQAARPVPQAQFASMQSARVIAPPVAPTRQAFIPTATGRPVARPAQQVMQRQVVARSTPPKPAPPLAERTAYLQQHAGQPLNYQQLRQSVPAAANEAANVRHVAAPARPVAAKPGERVGNAAAAVSRPAPPRNEATPVGNTRPQPNAPPQAQPAANAHGVPPNLRQNNSQAAQNGRYNERPAQPEPANRAGQAAQPAQPNRPQPANRPAPYERPATPQAPAENRAARLSRAAPRSQRRLTGRRLTSGRLLRRLRRKTGRHLTSGPRSRHRRTGRHLTERPATPQAPAENRAAPYERPNPQPRVQSEPQRTNYPERHPAPAEHTQPQSEQRREEPAPKAEHAAPAHEDHSSKDSHK